MSIFLTHLHKWRKLELEVLFSDVAAAKLEKVSAVAMLDFPGSASGSLFD